MVQFARSRGWVVRDGRIFFPVQEAVQAGQVEKEGDRFVMENSLGYARELETIV